MTCAVLPRYSMRGGGTVGWYGVSRVVLVLVLCGAVVGMPLSGVPHTAARSNQRAGVRLGEEGSTYTHMADVDQHAAGDSPREGDHVQKSNTEHGEYAHCTGDNASGCSDERIVTSLSELSLEDVEAVCGVEAAQLEKSKRALRDQVTRLQFRVRAADAEAVQAHADVEALRRELEAARAALTASSEHSARNMRRVVEAEARLEETSALLDSYSLRGVDEERTPGTTVATCIGAAWDVVHSSCVTYLVLALACLLKFGPRLCRKRGFTFPAISETSFDAMIPAVQPLLAEDAENPGYLFACVPLRQLPPQGRGAPLADDGGNGDFMKRAVRKSRQRGKRLVVIAYAVVAAPPNLEVMRLSYRELCLEATAELSSQDIVLVWHNMTMSDNAAFEGLVDSARWRRLYYRV